MYSTVYCIYTVSIVYFLGRKSHERIRLKIRYKKSSRIQANAFYSSKDSLWRSLAAKGDLDAAMTVDCVRYPNRKHSQNCYDTTEELTACNVFWIWNCGIVIEEIRLNRLWRYFHFFLYWWEPVAPAPLPCQLPSLPEYRPPHNRRRSSTCQ